MRSGFSLKNPALTRVELTHDFLTTVLILIFILIVGILCEVTTFNINRPLGRRQYSSVYSPGGSQTVSFTLLLCLALSKGVPKQFNLLFYDLRWQQVCVSVCLCVVIAIPFIPDVRLVDAPAEVIQEEGHTGFHFSTFLLRYLP